VGKEHSSTVEVERAETKILTSSGAGYGKKTISHGLLSLGVFLADISQRLFSFLQRSFMRLISNYFSSIRSIEGFL
jgi:hypothetical protein